MSYYIHFENELSIHTGLVKHVILWDSIHSLWAQLRSSFQRLQPLLGSIILAWLCTRNKWILASWHSDAWEHQFLCSGGMWWISRTAGRGGVLMLKVAEVWAPSRERSLGQCSLEIGALSYACWALGSFCMCGLFFTWVWVGNRVQNDGGGLAEQSLPWAAGPWWMLQAVRMPCKQSFYVQKCGAHKPLFSCPFVCCGIATSWVNTWAGHTTLTTVTSHKVIINQ